MKSIISYCVPVDRKLKISADHRILDPYVFETVGRHTWDEKVVIKRMMGLGLEVEFTVGHSIYIIANHVPAAHLIGPILSGLVHYNQPYEAVIEATGKPVTGIVRYGSSCLAGIYGIQYHKTLTILDLPLICKDPTICLMLLAQVVFNKDLNIERIFMDHITLGSSLQKLLSASGCKIYDTGFQEICILKADVAFLRESLAAYLKLPSGISFEMITLEELQKIFAEEANDTDNRESNESQDSFAYLIQDDDKQILGGTVCEYEDSSLYVELLWLHDSMRGKKLSEKLISFAEHHACDLGCTQSKLGTSSYQAPWLYPKLGYQIEASFKQGPYEGYSYKKSL